MFIIYVSEIISIYKIYAVENGIYKIYDVENSIYSTYLYIYKIYMLWKEVEIAHISIYKIYICCGKWELEHTSVFIFPLYIRDDVSVFIFPLLLYWCTLGYRLRYKLGNRVDKMPQNENRTKCHRIRMHQNCNNKSYNSVMKA